MKEDSRISAEEKKTKILQKYLCNLLKPNEL